MRIPGFGWEIVKSSETEAMAADIELLKQATQPTQSDLYNAAENKAKDFMLKSSYSETGVIGVEDIGFKARQQLYYSRRARLDNLYTIAFSCTQIRTAVINIRNEVFRRGFDEWEPKFAKKCTNPDCGNEFMERLDICPDCEKAGMQQENKEPWPTRDPDPQQYKRFKKFVGRANSFDQSLEDVLRECEDDINIADDGFLLLAKEYLFDKNDDAGAMKERVKEIVRLDPCNIEFDLDANGLPERSHYICLEHRRDQATSNVVKPGYQDYPTSIENTAKVEIPRCPDCNRIMQPAMYRYLYRGKYRFYTRHEVLHWSRYAPSKTYGYSPILSVYEKALTALGMDRWLYDYFYERIIPPGVIVTVTDDPEGLEARIKDQEMKMRENPHHISWVAVSKKSGQGKTEYIQFGSNFQEMDFQAISDRIGDKIAGMWGVSRIFMGVPSNAGGRETSTNQLVVMSRVVESAQKAYNQKVVSTLVEAFGIEDWTLILKTPDEKTESLVLEEESRKISNAAQMASMGFTVEMEDKGKKAGISFIYSGKAGGQQGMMGGEGMGGPMGGDEDMGGGFGGGGDEGGSDEAPEPSDGSEFKLSLDFLELEKGEPKPGYHKHAVKGHPGYENTPHPETQKHRTGEHADLHATQVLEEPWHEAQGVKVSEASDSVTRYAGKGMTLEIHERGDGSFMVVDGDSGARSKPTTQRVAERYVEQAFVQGTLQPKPAEAKKDDAPATFKGSIDVLPELNKPGDVQREHRRASRVE